jgi:hypothetical protein
VKPTAPPLRLVPACVLSRPPPPTVFRLPQFWCCADNTLSSTAAHGESKRPFLLYSLYTTLCSSPCPSYRHHPHSSMRGGPTESRRATSTTGCHPRVPSSTLRLPSFSHQIAPPKCLRSTAVASAEDLTVERRLRLSSGPAATTARFPLTQRPSMTPSPAQETQCPACRCRISSVVIP